MLSEKQVIYLRILELILPHIRNVEASRLHGSISPANAGVLLEAELIHNLPIHCRWPEMRREDVFWLNSEAREFVERGRQAGVATYDHVYAAIAQLFDLVPPDLQASLEWPAPRRD